MVMRPKSGAFLSLSLAPVVMKTISPVRSTLWLILEKIVAMGLSLGVTLAVARHLAPSQFGQLSYLLALVGVVTPLSALGLNAIVTRELVRRPEQNDTIMGTALGLRVLGAGVVGAITALLSPWWVDAELIPLFALLLLGNMFTAGYVVDYWLQAHVASRYAALVRTSVLLLMSLLRLLAVLGDAPLSVFIALAALELTSQGLAFLLAYSRRSAGLRRLRWCRREALYLLRHSGWLLFSAFAAVIYLKIDQIMLGQMVSAQEVGLYAVAARLSEVWYFFPTALVVSYFPRLLQHRDQDSARYDRQLQQLNDLLFGCALIVAVLTQLLAKPVIELLFGAEYAPASQILVIHIWAGLFIFMRELLSKWLLAENLLRFSLFTQCCGAIINVAFNWVLIPRYGAVGAAVATVISYCAASYLALFCRRNTWGMARMMTRSILLPIRLLRYGRRLYD